MDFFETLEPRRLLSLTGWWKLNESDGSLANDSSGSNHVGTLTNGPVWQGAGTNAGALQFDGTDDHVAVNTAAGSASSLSVAFWMKADAVKYQVPVDKLPDGSGGAGWNIKLRNNGGIWFRIGSHLAFTDVKYASTSAYSAGTWVHVTATFSGTSAKLYTNGTLRTTTTVTGRSVAEAATTLRFAAPSVVATSETFGGLLDDIRVYDHALSQSEVSAIAAKNSDLSLLVNALPSSTQQQALKKSTLAWALEDATSSTTAGLTTIAQDTYDDVRNLLPATIGNAQPAPANLLPAIPNFSTNPLASSAMSNVASLRSSSTVYTKNNSDLTISVTSQGRELAWGLTHPQSTYKGDSTVLTKMLRRFQKTFEANLGGVYDGDFSTSADAADMYRIFSTVYPDLVLPSRKVQWEAAIKLNADLILTAEGARYLAGVPGTSWVNADVRRLNALRFAYDVLGNAQYLNAANAALDLIETALMPDGGFMYDQQQNEVYTYHGENILALARYWQVTGSAQARDLVERSYWYYPLSIEPNGSAEYSSGSSWKHYWNAVTGSEAAYIVASLADSPENLRVAQWATPTASVFLSTFYRSDLAATASPDNYITYDRNVMGPRGRFGNFSFVGTATTYPANDNRGKSTFVGAMVTDFTGANNGWKVNSALDAAQSRVRFRSDDDINSLNNDVSFPGAPIVHYDLAQLEKNAYTVGRDFASLSTDHQLSKYKGSVQDWKGEQQWIYTPQRMVGLVSVEAMTNQSAYAILGSLRFVSGRASWGVQRSFVQVDSNTWQYGKLTVDIIDQNYGPVTTTYEDTWDATATIVDEKTGRLNFVESQAAANNQSTLINYAAGTRKYYLVEVRPNTTVNAADAVEQITVGNGLRGVQMKSGDTWLRMITNPTNSAISYTATMPWNGGVRIHTAGEQYRAAFLSAFSAPDTDIRQRLVATTPALQNGNAVTFTIDPHEHIVLEPWYGGDANGDRAVSTLDFNIMAYHFGGSGKSFNQGDFDYSGTVDSVDFGILQSNWGSRYTAIAAASFAPSVAAESLFAEVNISDSPRLPELLV